MEHRTRAPDVSITELEKVINNIHSINHSIGRTHSWRICNNFINTPFVSCDCSFGFRSGYVACFFFSFLYGSKYVFGGEAFKLLMVTTLSNQKGTTQYPLCRDVALNSTVAGKSSGAWLIDAFGTQAWLRKQRGMRFCRPRSVCCNSR